VAFLLYVREWGLYANEGVCTCIYAYGMNMCACIVYLCTSTYVVLICVCIVKMCLDMYM
jgi:thiamine transporter ThiT